MANTTDGLVDRFGTTDAEWTLNTDAPPSAIAALYRQHLLILRARQELGADFTAATVVERLAGVEGPSHGQITAGATRKVSRWLTGEQPFTIAESMVWATAFGGDSSTAPDLRDPASYPPAFGRALVKTADGALHFEAGRTFRWPTVCQDLAERVASELAALPASLFTSDVLRVSLTHSLVTAGVDRKLLTGDRDHLRLLEKSTQTIATTVALNDSDASYRRLLSAVADPRATDTLVAVIGPVPQARLNDLLPGSGWTRSGLEFTVPPTAFEFLNRPVSDSDAQWLTVATHKAADFRLWVAQRKVAK